MFDSTTRFTADILIFGEQPRGRCEILIGVPKMETSPAFASCHRYQKQRLDYDAPRFDYRGTKEGTEYYYHGEIDKEFDGETRDTSPWPP